MSNLSLSNWNPKLDWNAEKSKNKKPAIKKVES